MKTLSMRPALFEIENFLTPEECDDIKFMAETQGLEDSRTLLHGVFEVNDTTIADLIGDPDTSFQNADSNDDGVIDKDELAAGISFIGDISLDDQAINDLMNEIELDIDKDNVLSRQEFHAMLNNKTFQEIINYTNNMKKSEPNLLSRLSNTAFLNPLDHIGKKAVFETLKQRIQNVTGLSRDIIWTSEDLQVLRYDKQGHYHCHYDSEDEESHPTLPCCHYLNHYEDDNCLPCRYITFFYYLNEPEEGGETAFPIADDDSSAVELMRGEKRHLCDLSNHCHEAKIRYKPKTGTALFWYNHYIDEDTGWLGDLDKMSYHGGCDVTKGIKWAASNWINVGKDRELDLDAWKNYKKFIEDYDAVPQKEDVVMETKVNPKETKKKNIKTRR